METKEVLAEMLKENVGRSMLDSGGIPKYDADGKYIGSESGYGRAFERNQSRDFEAEQPSTLSWRYGLEVTHNVYHWLNERLYYSSEWQEKFDAYAALPENEDEGWLALMEGFFDHLRAAGHEVGGIYGDGDPFTVNTYNHQSLLSQTLQFAYGTVDGESVVLLQIHGGADVRGGYTAPKAFVEDGNVGDFAILDDVRGSVYCRACEARWSTDDGYKFNDDDNYNDKPLNDYAVVKKGDGHGDIEEVDRPLKGIVFVDDDGAGHCPKCAAGKLEAYSY